MSFKIVITDNDTGKELVNNDNVNAIIGAVTDDEKNTQLVFLKCSMSHLINTVIAAKEAVSKVENETPEISLFSKLGEIFKKNMEDKE